MNTRILAAPALALLLGACTAENNASVQWDSICLPPTDECVFEAECGNQYIGEYFLDVSVAPNLWLVVQMNNNRENNADPDNGRANTADAYIQEYLVSYSGGLGIPSTSHPVQYTVPAQGTSVVSVFAFDEPALSALSTAVTGGALRVTASIVARGIYADQSEFETAPFDVPVTVCDGCIGLPSCPVATPNVVGLCPPTVGQHPLVVTCE